MSTKTVQARVDSHLKEVGEGILKMLGVTPSQAINAFMHKSFYAKDYPLK